MSERASAKGLTGQDAIAWIKQYRAVVGYTLREAKDAFDTGRSMPEQSKETCSAIHLMSIYAHSRANACLAADTRVKLTTREREVLTWFAIGRSTTAVAERLGVSDDTVETQFRSAARKMKVRGRTHAVVEAIRLGEIVP